MAKAKQASDPSILQMALVGYEVERHNLEDKIRQIRSLLGGKQTSPGAATGLAAPAQRALSAAARGRIAAAQRKRWKEYRRRKEHAARG